MGYQKLTGSKAILGSVALTSTLKFVGDELRVEAASTDATKGGIKLGAFTIFVKKIPLTGSGLTATTSLTDTDWDAPYGSIIEDVFVVTQTAASSATNTIDVGIAGDPDGLLVDAQAVTTFTPTYANYGALLLSATTTFKARVPYYTGASTTRSITVTRSSTTFTATWVGNLYIRYAVPGT